jgi:hypothetical protein
MFTRALYRSPSWDKPNESISPHPISLRFSLLLSTHLHLGLPSGLFPSGFPINILYAFLFSPYCTKFLAHLILLDLIILIILGDIYKFLKGLSYVVTSIIRFKVYKMHPSPKQVLSKNYNSVCMMCWQHGNLLSLVQSHESYLCITHLLMIHIFSSRYNHHILCFLVQYVYTEQTGSSNTSDMQLGRFISSADKGNWILPSLK